MSIRNWSTTASSNNSAPPNGWPEGQAPSSVNNVGRQMMADIRETLEALPYFDFGHTPTRVDADTFTVATDLTAVYTAGKQLKFVGATTEYAIVTSSSYSAPDTTVEVSGTVPTSLSTVSICITAQPEYRRTAAEIAEGVMPDDYAIKPGRTARGDIRRYLTTGSPTAAQVATAVQRALASHNYAFIPGGDWPWNPVLFTGVRQRIVGDGFATQLTYDGTGTAIDFDGYAGCALEDFVLVSTNAAVGVDIGPNAGATRFAHYWQLDRVMCIGNTPNWATTSLASTRSGFTTAAIQVQTAFYGAARHCETSYSAGIGFRLFAQANGNDFHACHSRDNATGLKVEGTGSGNSNGNNWIGGNIEASIANSIGIDVGEADRNNFTGRTEISSSGTSYGVRINPPVGTLAQNNQFTGMMLTGTSAGYLLGDGTGSNQVIGTTITGGLLGQSVVINDDCIYTRIDVSPVNSSATITDDGYGSIVHIDCTNNTKWYERPYNQNAGTFRSLLVANGTTREDMGGNEHTFSFTGETDFIKHKLLSPGGTNIAVMVLDGYHLWINPGDGKLYLKSSAPTTVTDGTVVGTQT